MPLRIPAEHETIVSSVTVAVTSHRHHRKDEHVSEESRSLHGRLVGRGRPPPSQAILQFRRGARARASRDRSGARRAGQPRDETGGSNRWRKALPAEEADNGTIEPAKGKLGVMIPGMGAVATTFVAGVEAIRKGTRQAHRLAHPDGHDSARQAYRRPFAEGQGIRPARRTRRPGLHRLGHFRRQHVRRRLECRRARLPPARPGEAVPVLDHAAARRLRSQLREEDRRPEREEGQEQDGSGRAVARRHPRLQEVERREPPDHDVVRFDRVLHRADRGAPVGEGVREGAARERRNDRAFDDLRLCLADGGRALRQRRAEPDRRSSGDARTLAQERSCPSAARISRPARR